MSIWTTNEHLVRILRGLALLGVAVVVPYFTQGNPLGDLLAAALLAYIVPPALAADKLEEAPSEAQLAAFLAVLAAQTLALAWWIGGGRTWPRRVVRLAAVSIILLVTGSVLFAVIIAALTTPPGL